MSTAAPDRSAVLSSWISQGWSACSQRCCSSTPARSSKPPQERDAWCQLFAKWLTQVVGDTWATGPAFLRGIWAQSRRAGFRCYGLLLAVLCQQGDLVYGRPPVSKARLLLREQWVDAYFDKSVDESVEYFKGDAQQRHRAVPNGFSGLGIATLRTC